MATEGRFVDDGELLELAAGTARSAGEVFQLSDGTACIAVLECSATEVPVVRKHGVHAIPSASATTFAVGAEVWWDYSANKAITAPGEALDFYVGPACVAKVDGQLEVFVDLNRAPLLQNFLIQSRVIEVDCETGVQAAAQNIIPASWNKAGLIYHSAYGFITEAMAGAGQDQGIVTIEDSDGTDICTLTPSDAGADSLNDVIIGSNDIPSGATGDAAKMVAAGKGVQALVSQATSGAGAAGKMKVVALFLKAV